MDVLQIETTEDPFTIPEAGRAATTLLGRAESMGFLSELGTISHLDPGLIDTVLRRVGRVGLAQSSLMQGGIGKVPYDSQHIMRVLNAANEALEQSPLPANEWGPLRATLGDALLARLCRISEASLRRYASGARTTPDAVAQRLHVLALIVADLRGAYNDYGIRRWFGRTRIQLQGHAPETFVSPTWTPDDPETHTLRALAATLTASPAT